jgi:hypothetical protein
MDVALDWIKRARKASKLLDERRRCLREAEAVAGSAWDWMMIAEAWAGTEGGADDARRAIAAAFALDGRDASTSIDAAGILARELADPAGARDVLDRHVAALATRAEAPVGDHTDVRAHDWVRVAGAYLRCVHDRAAARACLDRGRARAETIDDLCTLAKAYVEDAADRDAARALIDRAATLAETDPCEPAWTLSDAYRYALLDVEAAWRVIERGIAAADTVARCTRMAAAAAQHADLEPDRHGLVVAALAKAEELAVTAAQHLQVAEAYYDRKRNTDGIRRCLDRAVAADADGAARGQIAHAHRHWLGDAVRADELAPRGAAPAAIAVARGRLAGWDPDPAALLDALRPRLTAKSLRGIAGKDYGMDFDKHLAALADIHATGLVPRPLGWYPREVLELQRWSEGAETDHAARAFACAILCIDTAGDEYHDGVESTIAVLIDSCLELDDAARAAATGLLVALVEAFDDDRTELAFALLGLILIAAARDPRDPRLAGLCERVIAVVDDRETRWGSARPAWGWLLGLTHYDSRHALWQSLAARLLAAPAAGDPALAHLAAIAARLRPA